MASRYVFQYTPQQFSSLIPTTMIKLFFTVMASLFVFFQM